MKEKRNSFSSSIGFVLAAAGSAVGLGNIWRFPYLAAKDGGGIFLLVYLVLALTFGFTLIVTEVSIGRKTKQSCLTAYSELQKNSSETISGGKSGFGKVIGVIASLVPFLILPYYSIIGGWVLKYAVVFCTGGGAEAAEEGFFGRFITSSESMIEFGRTDNPFTLIIEAILDVLTSQPVLFDVIFLLGTAVIIVMGVNKGIEAISKILMPLLLLVVIGIAVFSLTIKGNDGRTGLQGLKVLFVPDISGMTVKDFFFVVLDAMGQLFYSISVAMGIMVTYGSYYKDDSNLVKSVNQIEIFDTVVAFLAGVMIIPPVFAFMGKETMQATAGPSLVFVALPQVFKEMGSIGNIVGAVFFLMVLFAALTSCISILEAVVSSLIDFFGWSRKKATLIETVVALVISIIICMGYNKFYFELKLPNGSVGQILDIFDYLSNNIFMPIVAIFTCILIGWIVKPKTIIDEATRNGEKFGRKGMYVVMVKFVAPALLLVLLLGSLGLYNKL